MAGLPYLDAATVAAALAWPDAIAAIGRAVADVDLRSVPARSVVPIAAGELLLMPTAIAGAVGVKVLTIAPANPARGLPRIQGLYVLFDPDTSGPLAVLDGAALTTLRTPAVSAYAIARLAAPDASTLTVFGTGPQAEAHVHAIRAVRPVQNVVIVGRDPARRSALLTRLQATGIAASAGPPTSVAAADIVLCATTARAPVFDGRQLSADACVVAVGSHEPQARELDDAVFAGARRVVVEDTATALREAGDIIMAIDRGALSADQLTDLTQLGAPDPRASAGGRSVFKSVGMAWQDLAVAGAIVDATRGRP